MTDHPERPGPQAAHRLNEERTDVLEAIAGDERNDDTLRARAAAELLRRVDAQPGADPDAALTAALAAAQGKFPTIPKSSTAHVQGKDGKASYSYSYAELGDVLGAVRPVLSEHGLALTQPTVREGPKLVLRTTLRHTGGGELVSELELGVAPSNPQAFGGSLTYLRRYEACTLLGIAPEDDRDAQDVEPPRSSAPRAAAPARPAWAEPADVAGVRRRLVELVGETDAGELLEAIAGYCGGTVPRVASRAILGALARLEAAELIAPPAPVVDAERAAQDRAAEAPDTPTPDEDTTTTAPRGGDDADTDPPTEEELERAAAAEAKLEREPAGSVDPPADLPQDPAKAAAAMRAAGCICTDPLKGGGDDDACPIRGHGIPF